MRHGGALLGYDAVLLEELQGCEIAERLVGPDGVVDAFPLSELSVERLNGPGALGHLIELLGMGPLRPLDRAIELGAFRGQHEQADPAALALRFKGREEFGAPIHLDGPDGEGHARLHAIQKLHGEGGGGPAMGLQDIPARDHVAGGELFEEDPGHGPEIEGVELN